jgi:hypothetical protein
MTYCYQSDGRSWGLKVAASRRFEILHMHPCLADMDFGCGEAADSVLCSQNHWIGRSLAEPGSLVEAMCPRMSAGVTHSTWSRWLSPPSPTPPFGPERSSLASSACRIDAGSEPASCSFRDTSPLAQRSSAEGSSDQPETLERRLA